MSQAFVDLEWEFDAPHWYDFTTEDNDNPDDWFDKHQTESKDIDPIVLEAMQMMNDFTKSKTEKQQQEENPSIPKARHPTRIPIPASKRKSKTIQQQSGEEINVNLTKSSSSIHLKKNEHSQVIKKNEATSQIPSKFYKKDQIDRLTTELTSVLASNVTTTKFASTSFISKGKKGPVRVPLKEKKNSR